MSYIDPMADEELIELNRKIADSFCRGDKKKFIEAMRQLDSAIRIYDRRGIDISPAQNVLNDYKQITRFPKNHCFNSICLSASLPNMLSI